MLRYLLDTDICIYIAKHKPISVPARFASLAPGEAGISIITYGELLYGALKSQRSVTEKEVIQKFSDLIDMILNQILGMLKKLRGMLIIFSDTMKKFIDVYAKKVAELILLGEHMKIIIANKFI